MGDVMKRILVVLALGSSVLFAACGSGPTADTSGAGMQGAAAAQAEVEAAKRDTPLPPGATISVAITDQAGSYESGYGTTLVEGQAICAWFKYWLSAESSNDETAIAAAQDAAKKIPTWTIYTTADQSFRDLVNSVIDKATLGDPTPMSAFVTNNCGPTP
jgi:hypothetical protein